MAMTRFLVAINQNLDLQIVSQSHQNQFLPTLFHPLFTLLNPAFLA